MRRYKLFGYNSGGYKSSRHISFDGKIEKLWKPDPEHPGTERTVSYFKITYPDGTVVEKDNDFIQKILDSQSYVESFLVIEVIEISKTEQLNTKGQ